MDSYTNSFFSQSESQASKTLSAMHVGSLARLIGIQLLAIDACSQGRRPFEGTVHYTLPRGLHHDDSKSPLLGYPKGCGKADNAGVLGASSTSNRQQLQLG